MKPTTACALLVTLLVAAVMSVGVWPQFGVAAGPSRQTMPATSALAVMSHDARQQIARFSQLPVAFEVNQGQADDQIDFLARGHGYAVLLAPTEVMLSLTGRAATANMHRPTANLVAWPAKPVADEGLTSPTLRMVLVDANPRPDKTSIEELPGKANYFLGNDPARWRSGIATYAKVGYRDVYPGVDVVYYGKQRQLEFDFVVAPGADTSRIALRFEGGEKPELDRNGDVVLRMSSGPALLLHKPFVYQDIDGVRKEIAGDYVLDREQIRFRIGGYDEQRPLVIDPVVSYAARLGGKSDDAAYAIAVDSSGNAYITGDTVAADFRGVRPSRLSRGGPTDVFVAKLSADGSQLLYVTYLGGRSADTGFGIAVDVAGNAYITGDTRSPDFPVVGPVQSRLGGVVDIFVAKLSVDGSRLVYSTYIGGGGGERGLGIAVDPVGNAHVTGYTNSHDFPTVNALQKVFGGGNADAFVLKLNATGSQLIYATYFGGGNDRPEIGTAIAADAAGNTYVTGFTNSPDFPTFKPMQAFVGPTDVFVAKINPTGSALIYSTHLGGGADDEGMGIAVDHEGNAYVTGHTESLNFPTTAGAFNVRCTEAIALITIGNICKGGSAFISKISPDGSKLIYSTYLNGQKFEVGRGIAVDRAGNAYVTGLTSSPDFPTANAIQPTFGGGPFDAFAVKLNALGSALIYSTYLGGSGDDGGYGIAVDTAGNAYVAGYTNSPNFPAQNSLRPGAPPALATRDAFVVKITDEAATSR